ncbi:co-chaperone protein p23-1-like isoform X2 [Papaver somniferum]|uniref:co-chaperone protein p23-1-like isoform X2 n=1 Tax=Papaver somniferum TaxID=3469 RepID=UPI000E70010B|nr:co-chaperone protein p23-1-like isoform X2 [Papaver somniferum]
MSRHPTIKWAQRSDKIFLTVDLPDANDVKLKLEPQGRFVFSATKGGIPYEVDIELYDKINAEESKVNNGVRNIVYVIKKTESKWWNRLLKQEGKPPVFLKVDWDKWVDEDDETEKTDMDFNDMDFSKGLKKKKKKTKGMESGRAKMSLKTKGMKSGRAKMSLLQRILRRFNLKCICKEK